MRIVKISRTESGRLGERPYFFGGETYQCIVNNAPSAADKAKTIAKPMDDLRKSLARRV